MMTFRYMIVLLIVANLLVWLSGCNGTAQSDNPQVTNLTVTPATTTGSTSTSTSATATVPANGVMTITVTATTTNTTLNPITSTEWTEVSPVNGIIASPDSLNTTWQAPDWTGPGNEPVTLILTIKSYLGGICVQRVNLQVTPA